MYTYKEPENKSTMKKSTQLLLFVLVTSFGSCTNRRPIFTPNIPEDVEIPSNADPVTAGRNQKLDSTIVSIETPGRADSVISEAKLVLVERTSFRDGYGRLYSTYSVGGGKYVKKFGLPEDQFSMGSDSVLYYWYGSGWRGMPIGRLRLEFDCPCTKSLGTKLEFWSDSLATRLPVKLVMGRPKLVDGHNGKYPIPGISVYALDTIVSPKDSSAFLLAPVVKGNRVCKFFELERRDRFVMNGVKETFYQPHFSDYRHLDKKRDKSGSEYYTVDGVRIQYFVIVKEVPIVIAGTVKQRHEGRDRKKRKGKKPVF